MCRLKRFLSGKTEKLFICGTCKRYFGYKHVLKNHERTHTGEKPFQCCECKKSFSCEHHLKIHKRLHTGEKPYKCSQCSRKFSHSSSLKYHIKLKKCKYKDIINKSNNVKKIKDKLLASETTLSNTNDSLQHQQLKNVFSDFPTSKYNLSEHMSNVVLKSEVYHQSSKINYKAHNFVYSSFVQLPIIIPSNEIEKNTFESTSSFVSIISNLIHSHHIHLFYEDNNLNDILEKN